MLDGQLPIISFNGLLLVDYGLIRGWLVVDPLLKPQQIPSPARREIQQLTLDLARAPRGRPGDLRQ